MAKARKAKKNNGSTAPEGFPDKQWNLLSETWRDAAQGKSSDELEKEIIKAVRSMSTTHYDMKKDEKLEFLQTELKELKGGYTDAISINKAQIDYCVHLMNERGIPLAKDTIDAAKKAKADADED
jgi:hypothetical protein